MKRLDVLMKETAAEETFICLTLPSLACQEIEGGGGEGESGEQAHLYVWLPVCGTLRQPRFD